MTPICVSTLTIIGSDNGLSPGQHQPIIRTNAGILLIWPMRTNVSEILIEIHAFSLRKMHLKMSSGKWRPFCFNLNVLTDYDDTIFSDTQPRNSRLTKTRLLGVNTLRPRQHGRHFADHIFTCIFFNENRCILIKISLQYACKGPVDNNPILVQIMACRRTGDNPLSEPMMA